MHARPSSRLTLPTTDSIFAAMPKQALKAGESLLSLARAKGHLGWRRIYDHPANAGLRELRGGPNALLEGDEVFVPEFTPRTLFAHTGDKHTITVSEGRGVWNLKWSADEAWCGEKLKLTGETNLPDGDLQLTFRTRELESKQLKPLKVAISGGKFEQEWEVANVSHLAAGPPVAAFEIVTLEVTTTDTDTPCNVATLKVKSVPDGDQETFTADRSWSGFTNHTDFDQKIVKFANQIHVSIKALKGWGGTYVNLTSAGITGTAGGCPWAGHRWARPSGMSMVPAQYWDGAAWVALPAGFVPGATNYQAIGFYKSGANFVSPSAPGGSWPEAFADYKYDKPPYSTARAAWEKHIHNKWTDKWVLRRNGCKSDKDATCCRYTVEVVATFKEVKTYDSHVTILAPGAQRSNAALWFMGGGGDVAAHETGHHMDNPDEYAGGAVDTTINGDGAVNGIDADSIMGQNLTKTKRRHYGPFAKMTAKIYKKKSGKTVTFKAVRK